MIASPEEYEAIIEHADDDVRRRAVSEEASEQTWLAILGKRPDLSAEVAMNKRLPSSIIDRLIVDGCSRTKSLIAMKRSLSGEQFQRLAADQDESIRAMIANNKKTPPAILEQLACDECKIVSEPAIQRFYNH